MTHTKSAQSDEPHLESVELAISQVILGTSGIKNKYHSPLVNPPEMNAELDELFHDTVQAIQALIATQVKEARIDELEKFYKDFLAYGHRNGDWEQELKDRIKELQAGGSNAVNSGAEGEKHD